MGNKKFKLYADYSFTLIKIVYFVFLVIAILPFFVGYPEEEAWKLCIGLILMAHALLAFGIYFIKHKESKDCEIMDDTFLFNGKEYEYDKYIFLPVGFMYTSSGRSYYERWGIRVYDRSEKYAELLLFHCNKKKYKELVSYLMKKASMIRPVPLHFEIKQTEEPGMKEVPAMLLISAFISVIITVFTTPIVIVFIDKGIIKVGLVLFLIFFIVTFIIIISILLFKKAPPQINTLTADDDILSINDLDFPWDNIESAKLSCGWGNKIYPRGLEIRVNDKRMYYEYLSDSEYNQTLLEKWFYYKIPNRFEPEFLGKSY
jgi:Type III secretory pathway, component EscV